MKKAPWPTLPFPFRSVTPFLDRLRHAQRLTGSALCVGLDPDLERMGLDRLPPAASVYDALVNFCTDVVRDTSHVACAYKPNSAFFEAGGSEGMRALEAAVRLVREEAPHALVILDGKRGDIGNTAERYAAAAFEALGADALTVTPYMGRDAVAPFLAHAGRAAFVLARTSNAGAADVQDLRTEHGLPVYQHVARAARAWAHGLPGTLGFVVGATAPDALAAIRALAPDAPLLVPGVGAQGGDAKAVMDANAGGPLLVNVGRAIFNAPNRRAFADAYASRLRL